MPTPPNIDGGAQVQVAAISLEARAHLGGQFTRWCQHQRAHASRFAGGWMGSQLLQDRQREGSGLAGARLCAGQQVTTRQHGGNRLTLHGCRFIVALVVHSTHQFGLEAE